MQNLICAVSLVTMYLTLHGMESDKGIPSSTNHKYFIPSTVNNVISILQAVSLGLILQWTISHLSRDN